MSVKHTAKGDGIFKNGSKRGKTEGLVADEEKSGAFGEFLFDTEDMPE
jgi:hypothetical protein